MKKLYEEYLNEQGKLKNSKDLIGTRIVFNIKDTQTPLSTSKVIDIFENYIELEDKIGNVAWNKLHNLCIFFVILEDIPPIKIEPTSDSLNQTTVWFKKHNKTSTQYPEPNIPHPVYCQKCGLNCVGTMGYVCPTYMFPMGLGSAWC